MDGNDVRNDNTNTAEQRSLLSCSLTSQPYVMKRAPLGAYVTVTSNEGDRVYLRLKHEKENKCALQGFFSRGSGLQLLTVPISELKTNIEEEVRTCGVDVRFDHVVFGRNFALYMFTSFKGISDL